MRLAFVSVEVLRGSLHGPVLSMAIESPYFPAVPRRRGPENSQQGLPIPAYSVPCYDHMLTFSSLNFLGRWEVCEATAAQAFGWQHTVEFA